MNFTRQTLALLLISCGTTSFCESTGPEDGKEPQKTVGKAEVVKLIDITLAKGTVKLRVPESWKQKPTRSRIVEREFAIPAAKGDKIEGRLTMMRSGGSVEQNVERWCDQFTQPDNKPTKDAAKVEKKKINDQEVVIVDISGTFKDSQGRGPFAGGRTIEREGYRMLGGIVQTKKQGQYFFKLYGPKHTIASAAKSFTNMMASVTSK